MTYKWFYKTPEGFDDMYMNSDGDYLTGLWFVGSKDVSKHIVDCKEKELSVFKETCQWLDIYFSGESPDFTPKYKINNLTPFRKEVIDIMNTIPFGSTLTYKDISKMIADKRGIKKMSSQAVGGAVGHNPVSLIIPCHRVVGTDGSLTGYAGGIEKKRQLLTLERAELQKQEERKWVRQV